VDLYRESRSEEVKQAVIQAHVFSDEPGTLLEILKSEQDVDLQIEIIHTLGVMDATEDLRELYPTLASERTRVAALEAFFMAGDVEMLRQVLETETDPRLRETAIHGIAMNDGKEAAILLESVYDNASSSAEKKAVLEALVMMDEAGELALKIVRTETDTELRHEAIRSLGIMDATGELGELYSSIKETELRMTILESMMIADDTDGVIKVLQTETDPELRAAAMQALSMNGDSKAAKYLVSLYPEGSHEEKQAIIEAMMMMEDPEGLIGLLKNETDPELKREMLQVLTMMDSEASDQYLFELLESER
jgi:HEAT repeat protein